MHTSSFKKHLLALSLSIAAPLSAAYGSVSTGYLYVSDYGTSTLDRFQYTYDSGLNQITGFIPYGKNGNTTNAYFLGDATLFPVKEGIHGTTNDIILVGGSHGSAATVFTRYNFDGTQIGTIPVNFSGYNGGNVGIGNTLITPDGKYLYAPLEAGNAVVKIDLATGNIIKSVPFTGAHDVAIAANGDVYAANYSGFNAKIMRLDSDLNILQGNLIAPNSATFRPSGLSFLGDGSLLVQNNTAGGNDSVLRYTFSGSGVSLTASLSSGSSYLGDGSHGALEFTFGNNVGPDGKLYIAALGGGGTGAFSTRNPYTDGIYVFDPITHAVALAIPGYNEGVGASTNGLMAPKYLQFDTNFVKAPDAGYSVPEASGSLFGLIFAGALSRRSFRALRGI